LKNIINQVHEENYSLYNADSADILSELPDQSIDFSIFSPPYLSIFVYSNSLRDLGNSKDEQEFFIHFNFIVDQLFRTIKPGRIIAVDCMNVPAMKERDGYIGLKDFRGDIIRTFIRAGFIFHSEHCIWKDPLIEATRTKALGLMHKQLCKDSSMCRAGIPQYLLAFRKPGVNANFISHGHGLNTFAGEEPPTTGNLSHERWRRYASPVWMDIDLTNTLNARAGRDGSDERHLCPMALDIIERGIWLWSNPDDTVLSPFMGIGSEGWQSLQMGRKFIGIELKPSYFDQAVKNMPRAISRSNQKQVALI